MDQNQRYIVAMKNVNQSWGTISVERERKGCRLERPTLMLVLDGELDSVGRQPWVNG